MRRTCNTKPKGDGADMAGESGPTSESSLRPERKVYVAWMASWFPTKKAEEAWPTKAAHAAEQEEDTDEPPR
jgi:hypothetical protein